MLSYQCGNCGAQWTVYAICLDCPFCYAGYYYRQQQDRLYKQRLTTETGSTSDRGTVDG